MAEFKPQDTAFEHPTTKEAKARYGLYTPTTPSKIEASTLVEGETKAAKITSKQLEALQAVAQGLVIERNCGSAAFRISGANPSVVGRLRSFGFIRWTKYIGGDAELTDAGRAALAKAVAS